MRLDDFNWKVMTHSIKDLTLATDILLIDNNKKYKKSILVRNSINIYETLMYDANNALDIYKIQTKTEHLYLDQVDIDITDSSRFRGGKCILIKIDSEKPCIKNSNSINDLLDQGYSLRQIQQIMKGEN